LGLFFIEVMQSVPAMLRKPHILFEQMMRIGVNSLSIVFLASMFIGAVYTP
jgi:ABC-type transporter Mla maintaining outer membrane lipid asymmetry permease subunit MlaE